MREEIDEYYRAKNKANKVKEACDIAYVLYGILNRFGLEFSQHQVHEESNNLLEVFCSIVYELELYKTIVLKTIQHAFFLIKTEIDTEYGEGTYEDCFNLVDAENMMKVSGTIEKDETGKILKKSLPHDYERAESKIGKLLIEKMKSQCKIGVTCNGNLLKYS